MIGLLLLKHIYGLSDGRWIHDPCFQFFTGGEFFRHDLPHVRSDMTHWRKRIGDRLARLLAETLRVAHDTGALKKDDMARIAVDTTVQPKDVTFPADAKLLLTAIEQLSKLARQRGVPLSQSCTRVARKAAMMAGRIATPGSPSASIAN